MLKDRVDSLLNEVESKDLEVDFIDFLPFSGQLVLLIDLAEEFSSNHKFVGRVLSDEFIQLGATPSIFRIMFEAFAENLEPEVRILNFSIFLCSIEPLLQIDKFVIYINLSFFVLFLHSDCTHQSLSICE